MKLYTGKGDSGETGILGKGRLPKDHPRIEAYGTVDELNSVLGLLIHDVVDDLKPSIQQIQSTLFEIGSELASAEPKEIINDGDIKDLEELIDQATDKTSKLTSFILPGGSKGASWLHLARTVCRRAERRVVSLSREVEFNPQIIVYLNRLSDLFFAWARYQNHASDIDDITWEAR